MSSNLIENWDRDNHLELYERWILADRVTFILSYKDDLETLCKAKNPEEYGLKFLSEVIEDLGEIKYIYLAYRLKRKYFKERPEYKWVCIKDIEPILTSLLFTTEVVELIVPREILEIVRPIVQGED